MALAENWEWFLTNISIDTLIKCPSCDETSLAGEWKDVEPYCETCGSHLGIVCPLCDKTFDHVWDTEKFKNGN